MKKRIFATAMCIALIATVLTACGGKDGKNENTTEEVTTATEVTTEEVKETEESTQVTKPTETEESTDVTPTEEGSTGAKDDGTSSTDNTAEVGEHPDMVVEEDVTDNGTVIDTRTSYTKGPFTFEMPAGENSYVAQLEAAGLISDGQLDGTYINIDSRGNFIICMPGTGSGEVYDIGYPGEDSTMTEAQENTFNEVFYGEFNAYKSGEKSAVDLNGDGTIEDFENYICAAATCGLNLRGSISDVAH